MPASPRTALSRLRPAVLALAALTVLTGLGAASAEAAPAHLAAAPAPARAGAPAAAPANAVHAAGTPAWGVVPDVSTLTVQGATTTVTVHRIYRSGQRDWVSHVLDTRLADVSGCQAVRSPSRWNHRTYRATVRTVCLDGTGPAERAAAQLVRDRPWYLVSVRAVPLTGFSLLADLPSGNDRAYPATVAVLPKGPLTLSNGDDVSVDYVGDGVTQAQLRAAVAAFAGALGIPTSKVAVLPIVGG